MTGPRSGTKITSELDRYQADLLEVAAHAINATGASYTRPDGGKVNFGVPGGHDLDQFKRVLPEILLENEEFVVQDLWNVDFSSSRPHDSTGHATRFVIAIRVLSADGKSSGALLVFDARSRSAPLSESQLHILRVVGRLLEA